MHKTVIGVLFGGKSAEHEVSISSARTIVQKLEADHYDVIPLALTKENKIVSSSGQISREAFRRAGAQVLEQKCMLVKDEYYALPLTALSAEMFDVVIPVIHGSFGEDGRLQGFLEMLGIPYVGSNVLGSAIGMDKVLQKQLGAGMHIPMVPFTFFQQYEWDDDAEAILQKVETVCGYPCFVKPANTGSSVGISKALNRQELEIAITAAQVYDTKVIVEKGLVSPREIEAAVIGYRDVRVASAFAEVKPDRDFYDYDAKYSADSQSKVIIPADLAPETAERVKHLAEKIYRLVNASGLARIDFFIDADGSIYWNEINTLPGFTPTSAFARMWEASGLTYAHLLEYLIACALERSIDQNSICYEA